MDYVLNIYGLLVLVGIVAMGLIAWLYFKTRRNTLGEVATMLVETDYQPIKETKISTPLTKENIRASLVPCASNQPVFMHQMTNLIDRIKRRSDIALLKTFIEELQVGAEVAEAKTVFLQKLDELDEEERKSDNKPLRVRRQDELADLGHKKQVAQLKRDIAEIKKPLPQERAESDAVPEKPQPDTDQFAQSLEHAARVITQIEQLEKFRMRWYADIELKYPQDGMRQGMMKDTVDRFIDHFKTRKGW